ncbi:MAG: transglycosylase domain-containing protein [Bacteroidales bacterium]|nr:transglycosylase domain-containing protein [Bacteroidales bacterium]
MKYKNRKKIAVWIWGIFGGGLLCATIFICLVWAFADIPSFEELENPENKLATQVISEDGQILTTFHIENRSYISYDELSPYLVQAAVATEDVRFYKHSGIDFRALCRVAFKTILLRNSSQGGGSTLTQQLAKTLYPREDDKGIIKMVWIKIKEWITAVKIERNYTKNEIITMYMNSVFFGSNAYGIKAATNTFFAKEPKDVTIEEAATLVGMVNKPTRYNPALNPDKSLDRRNFVISQMEKAKYISKAQRDSICLIPITLSYQVQDHNSGIAPYFRDMLRRTMNAKKPKKSSYRNIEDYQADSLRWKNDGLYGFLEKTRKADGSKYNLDKDGLRIYTTINYKMQKYAEEAVDQHLRSGLQKTFFNELKWNSNRPFARDVDQEMVKTLMMQARRWSDRYITAKNAGLSEQEILKSFDEPVKMRVFAYNKNGYVDTTMTPNDSIRYYKSFLRASFIAIEPFTGHVKAYVGGNNYRYFKYDNVTLGKRQVGSVIKPFLYTLAMEQGMTPCDRVTNVPQSFIVNGEAWTPHSTDKPEMIGKTVTLKWGLTKSSNNISAYLMKVFGPEAMAKKMKQMGISSHIDAVPSLCVGPADISLCEMVAAYNTYPSQGLYIAPLFVTRIEDNLGNVIGEFTTHGREAMSEETASLMQNLMMGVVRNGTGYRLRTQYKLMGEIAGKTGTTNDQSDGWFIGYTPKLTAGIWVGGEDRQIHFATLANGSGGNMACPIWGIFMSKVIKDGTLGISEEDKFPVVAGAKFNLDCSGGDGDISDSAISTSEGGDDGFFF